MAAVEHDSQLHAAGEGRHKEVEDLVVRNLPSGLEVSRDQRLVHAILLAARRVLLLPAMAAVREPVLKDSVP